MSNQDTLRSVDAAAIQIIGYATSAGKLKTMFCRTIARSVAAASRPTIGEADEENERTRDEEDYCWLV